MKKHGRRARDLPRMIPRPRWRVAPVVVGTQVYAIDDFLNRLVDDRALFTPGWVVPLNAYMCPHMWMRVPITRMHKLPSDTVYVAWYDA